LLVFQELLSRGLLLPPDFGLFATGLLVNTLVFSVDTHRHWSQDEKPDVDQERACCSFKLLFTPFLLPAVDGSLPPFIHIVFLRSFFRVPSPCTLDILRPRQFAFPPSLDFSPLSTFFFLYSSPHPFHTTELNGEDSLNFVLDFFVGT